MITLSSTDNRNIIRMRRQFGEALAASRHYRKSGQRAYAMDRLAWAGALRRFIVGDLQYDNEKDRRS